MSIVFIYGLVDPRTEQVRYIGQTKDIKRRLRNHLNDAKRGVRSHKFSWIRKLITSGVKPKITVIEKCNGSIADEREQYWISYYREKEVGLTNQTDGGFGVRGYVRTDEEKRTISKRMKGNKHGLGNVHTEEYKREASKRLKGRVFTDEHKRKIKEAAQKRTEYPPLSDEHKQALLNANLGKVMSEEAKRKIGKTLKGNQNAKGYKQTEDHKQKVSKSLKGYWAKKKAEANKK